MKTNLIRPGVHYGTAARSGFDVQSLQGAAKRNPEEFMRKMDGLISSGQFTMNDFAGNIKRFWGALAGVQVPVVMPDAAGYKRSITASVFPILSGNVMIKSINDQYEAIPTIGEQLVTDFDDDKKVTTMVSLHNLDNNVEEVKETGDFPEIGATEESVEIRHKKNGRKLSISAEMIRENDSANIIERVNALSQIASDWIEEQTLERVTDHHGSASSAAAPYVYNPAGTGTALFSATANTPGTRAPSGTRINSNPIVDESDFENARIRLNSMLNARGKRIAIPTSERVLLVPDAVLPTALTIMNSTYVPGVENELSNWGPQGRFKIATIISSPKLDDLSTSAWYYGAPKKQFRRKWKMRLEYVTLGQDTQAYLNAQIAFQARIAWDVEIGALDYVYWIQNLSATTAPKDE
jgi:hypothetical protein